MTAPAQLAAFAPGSPLPDSPRVAFALKLGAALHRHGAPAHRLEELLTRVVAGLGVEASFFATPTAIFASFGPPEALATAVVRAAPGEIDLGHLVELDALTAALIRRQIDFEEAARRLDALLARPPRYGGVVTVSAFALAAASAARLFSGGLHETLLAAALGLLVGLLALAARRFEPLGRIQEAASAFLASLAAAAAARVIDQLSVEITTISALVVLLPGLSLTVALTELSTRHLMSGTARLAGAATALLQLTFGVALGTRLGALLPGTAAAWTPVPPDWTLAPALVGGSVGLVVLLRGRGQDLWPMALTSVAGYLATRGGAVLLGSELGAFAGALVAGVTANTLARLLDRPAVVALVPALLLLVPGSVGLRSLTSLLARDVVGGVGLAFSMVLVGVSLVAGLLLANVLVSPRRQL